MFLVECCLAFGGNSFRISTYSVKILAATIHTAYAVHMTYKWIKECT